MRKGDVVPSLALRFTPANCPFRFRSDIRTFNNQPNVILHVGLVKAKPQVFIDEIKYLLVLSTAKCLILIGVAAVPLTVPSSTNDPPRLDVKLYDTGFTYTAKEMECIVGTKQGRIFMCGSEDGYLYELTYQSSEGWFSKKIDLICHSTAGGITNLLPMTLSSWRLVPTTDGSVQLSVLIAKLIFILSRSYYTDCGR